MGERFKRVRDFYGDEGFQRIRESGVLVAGLGGVGSHCAIGLARSGIGYLRLVDFDVVTESSLNRNPLLHESMAGKQKTVCMEEKLLELCPDTSLEISDVFICQESLAPGLLTAGIHAVADAIDGLNPKTQLLQYCVLEGIPVFSSMGAAGRRDVSGVRTGGIEETSGCPLARNVRKYLRRRGITSGITCVWSTEEAPVPLPPDDEPRLCRRGRIRNALPSLITLPGVFGYTIAQLILDSIAADPH